MPLGDFGLSNFEKEVFFEKVPSQLFINGSWVDACDSRFLEIEDPSDGSVLGRIADAEAVDAALALDAAEHAQSDWAATSPRYRSIILRDLFDALVSKQDLFATLISLEMGKSFNDAKGEVVYAAEFLRWFSEEAVRLQGQYQMAPNGGMHQIVSKMPVGPCLLVSPWNFPLAMLTRKIGPAIAAGCTMIVKPSELTPLTAALFFTLLQDVGLPPGAANLIVTTNAETVVGHLLNDPRLRKVSFTGSTNIGRKILEKASQNILRSSMELGGNAPFIVFEDADIELAVECAFQAKLRNIGQACTAANRFYVHEAVKEKFIKALVIKFQSLEIGRGLVEREILGPLISSKARSRVHNLVKGAVKSGAKIECGGVVFKGAGNFYPPTILSDVHTDAPIMREEIFGPVAPIATFSSEQEVISLANDTEYGLAGYICTQDLDRIFRMRSKLFIGMLGVNAGVISDAAAPFGGVKHSGFGREGGTSGIDEYLNTQYMAVSC